MFGSDVEGGDGIKGTYFLSSADVDRSCQELVFHRTFAVLVPIIVYFTAFLMYFPGSPPFGRFNRPLQAFGAKFRLADVITDMCPDPMSYGA